MSLDERRNVAVGGAGEQVALPVAGDRAVGCLRGPLADRNGVDDFALAAVGTTRRPRPADRARAAQVREQLPLQRASRLDEQGEVDRFVRHPHSLVVGEREPQPAGDLRRRPVLPQLRRHQIAQDRIAGELASLWSPRTLPGAPIGLGGPVPASAAMAIELTGDRRRRSAEPRCDPSRRVAGRDPARDLLSFLERQRKSAPAPLARSDPAVLANRAMNGRTRPIERPSDLADRLAPLPPLPQLPALLHRVVPPRLCHRNTSSSTTEPMLRRRADGTVTIGATEDTAARSVIAGQGSGGRCRSDH